MTGAGPTVTELQQTAQQLRREVVKAVAHARGGHLGGPLSAADILTALYFRVLDIRPEQPGWPDRDRFVLSKGHSSIALYAALALRGYFPLEELGSASTRSARACRATPTCTPSPALTCRAALWASAFRPASASP